MAGVGQSGANGVCLRTGQLEALQQRELPGAFDVKTLVKCPRRTEVDRPARFVAADLLEQTALEQGGDDGIGLHPTNTTDLRSTHWLQVGHDGEGLKRRGRQALLCRSVAKTITDLRDIGARSQGEPPGDLGDLEPLAGP